MRRALFLLTLLVPCIAIAQERLDPGAVTSRGITLRIYVSLGDDQQPFHPLGRYPLLLFRSQGDSTVLHTDDAGAVTTILPAGEYRLVSAVPAVWRGGKYAWSVVVRVHPGMGAANLTAENAYLVGPQDLVSAPTQATAPAPAPSAYNANGGYGQTPRRCCEKDPTVSFFLSFLLPGGGQFYNGETGKGIGLLFLQIGGVVVGGVGAAAYNTDHSNRGAQAAIVGGYGVAVVAWIYSMVDASPGAHRHNRELGLEPPVAVSPYVAPGPGGRTQVGLRLAFR